MNILERAKNFVLSFNEQTQSKELKVMLESLELNVYTGSIFDCKVDAVVNSLDPNLEFKNKTGLVKVMYEKFGPMIETETKRIGKTLYKHENKNELFEKCIMVKSGAEFPKFVLNAITPFYSSNHEEFSARLYNTFENILNEAKRNTQIKSIAIPLLATGNYGAPKDLCSNVLVKAIENFSKTLSDEKSNLKVIKLVNLDKDATKQLIKEFNKIMPDLNASNDKYEAITSPAFKEQSVLRKYDEKSAKKNNLIKENDNSMFITLRNELNQTFSCDWCKQRIKLHHLNVLKTCRHKYCFGCTIGLRNNRNKCLLIDHIDHNDSHVDQNHDFEIKVISQNDNINSNDNSIRENTNDETFNEIQKKECKLCCEEMELIYLYKCRHEMCVNCYKKSFEIAPKCPFCLIFYRTPKGDQPSNGSMKHRILKSHLPGYSNVDTIEISYSIPNGLQTSHHPNPGRPYAGIDRVAYLPDNEEGKKILTLLYKSFEYGLTFTVGNSRTTKAEGVITWNDIHHKTSTNGSPYGYPDDGYLKRVREELKAKGIE